jgi:uncharacterized protein (DUF58 family)
MDDVVVGIREAVIRRARRIELRTRRVVTRLLAGDARSIFRGTGIEFDSVREYSYGDDVRAIDWNVTARAGRPYVKRFVTTRERDLVVVADRSASMRFGSGDRTKSDVAAELTAVLALVAARGRERIGLIECGARDAIEIEPRRRRATVEHLVRRLVAPVKAAPTVDWEEVRQRCDRVLKRRALLFVVSDFNELPRERDIAELDLRHEVIAVRVFDPREEQLVGSGVMHCFDPETSARFALDAGSARERAAFASAARIKRERIHQLFARAAVASFDLSTADVNFRAFFDFLAAERTRVPR